MLEDPLEGFCSGYKSASQAALQFLRQDIPLIKHIEVGTEKVMTIENKTSFQRMIDKECSYLYLGGYANRHQITFLKKVMADNMRLEYLHFGDIVPAVLIHRIFVRQQVPFALILHGSPELL